MQIVAIGELRQRVQCRSPILHTRYGLLASRSLHCSATDRKMTPLNESRCVLNVLEGHVDPCLELLDGCRHGGEDLFLN